MAVFKRESWLKTHIMHYRKDFRFMQCATQLYHMVGFLCDVGRRFGPLEMLGA